MARNPQFTGTEKGKNQWSITPDLQVLKKAKISGTPDFQVLKKAKINGPEPLVYRY